MQRAEAPEEPELLDPQTHAVPGWEDFAEEDIHDIFRQLVAEDPAIQLAGEELDVFDVLDAEGDVSGAMHEAPVLSTRY